MYLVAEKGNTMHAFDTDSGHIICDKDLRFNKEDITVHTQFIHPSNVDCDKCREELSVRTSFDWRKKK